MPSVARDTMFALKKTFELGVCLLGYRLGQGLGGWGGGVILAFMGLFATSYGSEKLEQRMIAPVVRATPQMNFLFGAAATLVVLAVSFANWGRTY